MALIRNWRTLTQGLETPTTIAADSANIVIGLDNVDTGLAQRESLQMDLDDLASTLNIMGTIISPDASETVAGLVEIATDTEFNDATDTGGSAELVVRPSQLEGIINPDLYQVNSSLSTSDTKRYSGNTEFVSEDSGLAEIDSYTFETRVEAGTTWTSRASLAALNTYANTIGATTEFYLRVTATFDAAYTGFSTIALVTKPLL